MTQFVTMVGRILTVWCNGARVGDLKELNGIWSFEYDPEWTGFDLAPSLPRVERVISDGGSFRPVQWFFDNLLPEEGARELLAQDARVSKADAFGLLERFGAESAGALTLLKPNESPVDGHRTPLSFETLSDRIRGLPDLPLSRGGSKRMSMAGAQHKLPVIFDDGELFEPDLALPSTHILKPQHSKPELYPNTVMNEYAMMEFARAAHMEVPGVHIIRVPEPAYLVERFDRRLVGGRMQRLHAIDACQLLSLDRSYKYDQCNANSLEAIVDRCRSKASTRLKLYRWFVFNCLIGNTDNHLKNLSFFMTPDGIELAPHYDLVSTAIYEADNRWLDADLVWRFGSASKLGDVDKAYLDTIADVLKVPRRLQGSLHKDLIERIPVAYDALYASIERQEYPDNSKGSDARLLRLFRFGLYEDISRRLQESER